jgi:hypothetical protein
MAADVARLPSPSLISASQLVLQNHKMNVHSLYTSTPPLLTLDDHLRIDRRRTHSVRLTP